jgi:hypothetical protein
MNVEIGTETLDIPFLGIFVSKFRYFVFAVQQITESSNANINTGMNKTSPL